MMTALTASTKRTQGARLLLAAALVTGTLLAGSGELAAQSLTVERQVLAPAGGRASGGDWTLDATLGQTAIGRASGGEFVLDAGFWTPEPPAPPPGPDTLFSNGFEDTP